jgi:hypothetical protein
LKFFFHPFKIQAGSSNYEYQTKPDLIGGDDASQTHNRMFQSIGGATKGGGEAREGGVAHRSLADDYHRKCKLVFWNGAKRISMGDLFFRCADSQELGARPPE